MSEDGHYREVIELGLQTKLVEKIDFDFHGVSKKEAFKPGWQALSDFPITTDGGAGNEEVVTILSCQLTTMGLQLFFTAIQILRGPYEPRHY